VLGRVEGTDGGPTVVVFGGIHGNEPAGALAAREVAEQLATGSLPLRGRYLALCGNLQALRQNRRYLDRDLNRRWADDEIARLRTEGLESDSPEDREQAVLLELIDEAISLSDRPVVFLDLHSTSGEGPPFACMSDTLRNRKIALALPVPVILGLEEVIDGTMLGYLSDLGHCGVAIEGGQHEHPSTVARHVAGIWLALVAAGCLRASEVPGYDKHCARLERDAEDFPRVVDIQHRHVVQPGDAFVMGEGFASFQPLAAGKVVAHDQNGDIRAPRGGLMLLPRYQGQGEDGYFIAREISFFWLLLSQLLRRLHLDRLVGLVPGLRRHARDRDRRRAGGSCSRGDAPTERCPRGFQHPEQADAVETVGPGPDSGAAGGGWTLRSVRPAARRAGPPAFPAGYEEVAIALLRRKDLDRQGRPADEGAGITAQEREPIAEDVVAGEPEVLPGEAEAP
jgi:succinylglutamate desuccinylase